ncbi:hypothetical protein BDN67DRAFT_825729 [Paxillus ammoniavirescens]|nr:hypothetical protein BDN67DRAFT_825729 [Paxillus ammoniavirescens]
MPNTPEVIITLNCLPLGGGSMNVSPIEMDKTETVGTLKELIKSNFPIAFRDVDADDLVLWEAPESLLCNNNAFKETIEGLNLQDEKRLQLYKLFKNPTSSPYHKKLINVTRAGLGEPLQNTDHLSELFVEPLAKGRIHIIVDTPYPEICCWLRGDEVENSFGIHISANARISLLAEQIKVAKSDPRAVVDKRIRLYKVSADDDDELRETLHSPGTGHLLDGRRLISTSFLDVPVLQDYYIIVEFATESK